MEKIGKLLKERRLELGYSIQQMHEKTKLSIAQLEAIERGDIRYFRDDLSYLSYFVRYYANALNLNYDDLREEMDQTISDFTESLTLTQIQKQEAMTTNIKKKSSNESKPKFASRAMKPKKQIVDFKTFGLVLVALAILGSIVYVSITYLPKLFNQDPIEKPVIVAPGDKEPNDNDNGNNDETPNEEIPEEIEQFVIKEIDPTTFEVSGLKEGEEINLKVVFNNRSWTSFSEDNVQLQEPKGKIYEANTDAIVKTKMKDQKILTVHFGYLNGNTITINDKAVELNPTTASSDVAALTFKFIVGSTTE